MSKLMETWADYMAILLIVVLTIGVVFAGSMIWLIWALVQHFSK